VEVFRLELASQRHRTSHPAPSAKFQGPRPSVQAPDFQAFMFD